MEKVKSFVLDSRGGMITLQITTLLMLGGLFYAGINWKRDIEESMKNRWSSVHMTVWTSELSKSNPELIVPSVNCVIDHVE